MASIDDIMEFDCEKSELKSNEQGTCPHCNGYNIEYGSLEFEDDQMAYYPCTCEDCGTEFNEWYELNFVSHDQVYVNNEG